MKMKRFFHIEALLAAFLLFSLSAYAQNVAGGERPSVQNRHDWREKMRSEKIGYLTEKIGLTVSESEKFWPIYRMAENERREAFRKVVQAYKALEEAVASNASEFKLEQLLDEYFEAQSEVKEIDEEFAPKYRKVLSADKVARLFLAEEKFRREQIHKLYHR